MNNSIRAILVDDEEDSLITIKEQIQLYCPEIEVVASFTNPERGLSSILRQEPDVVFLDIKMPKINGLELARRISNTNTKVVFVTAYDNYAIPAIKLSALDYLLKPIQNPEVLLAVIEKIKMLISHEEQIPVFERLLENEKAASYSQDTQIGLADERSVQIYKIREIISLKAERNCCMFHFTNHRKKLVTKNLGSFTKALQNYNLVQVNRAEIVNLEHVKEIIKTDGSYLLMSNGDQILISSHYKKNIPYFKERKKSVFTFFLKKV